MPDLKQCSCCGASIPSDAPLGNCPQCLVGLGLGPGPGAPAPTVSEETPVRFGDYELLEPIGRGGMGMVYKARQVSLSRIIALKMLSPHSAAFPRVAERLRLEAEAAASVHHPNIVTIHDVGEVNGRPYFTMAFVDGVGMDKWIGKSGFRVPTSSHPATHRSPDPLVSAVHILISLARAVDHAHKHGVLHRDLKPANVVMDSAGTPHLTDFGLAKVLGRERTPQTDTASVLGTPAYMSPEQASGGTRPVSTSSDIYSLGAMFYEMLTGQPPLRGNTPLETLRRATEEEPRSPTDLNQAVDTDLATICLRCLEKDPERRYPTALALAEDLERWLRHEPIEARPLGTAGRFYRWCRREPGLAGMAVGLFILLTATTLLAWTLYYRERERLAIANEEKAQRKAVLFERIDKDWQLGGRNGVRVYAPELAVLAERSLSVEGDEIEIVLGVHQPRQAPDPLQILQRYNLLVNALSGTSAPADIRFLFELQIYPAYSNALVGLALQECHVMLLTPATYGQRRREDPEVYPLAQFASGGKRAIPTVIFCRRDLGIRTLADLQGKSLAFGFHDRPIFEHVVKSALLDAGLRNSELRRIEFLPRGTPISAVRAGEFDAGVATLNEFVRHTNAGAPLQIIQEVATPNYLWAATGKLPKNRPAAIQAIQQRFVAIRNVDALAALDETLTGFVPVTPDDLDGLEKIVEGARRFDAAD